MLCEKCKVREANIRYTEVINGVATEHNLCSHCAKEMDFGHYTGLAGLFDAEYPIGKILSQLLGVGGREEDAQAKDLENLVCPTCHTSYGDFVKNSEFGCPDCYRMFDLLISDKLKQLHGSDTHTGKHPAGEEEEEQENLLEKPLSVEEQIGILRSKLQEAVSEEDYEAAARYRDEIHALEKEAGQEPPEKMRGRKSPGSAGKVSEKDGTKEATGAKDGTKEDTGAKDDTKEDTGAKDGNHEGGDGHDQMV